MFLCPAQMQSAKLRTLTANGRPYLLSLFRPQKRGTTFVVPLAVFILAHDYRALQIYLKHEAIRHRSPHCFHQCRG